MTTLRMGDGPVENLPAGLEAYAGYVDDGGDGITYPGVVAKFPKSLHLSISVHGAPARVGDVEKGALNSWQHYEIGYTAVSNVGAQILRDGRPKVLWVAHYTNIPHICTSARCWPSSPVPWVADGSQWTTHNNLWDESLVNGDAFFPSTSPNPPTSPPHAKDSDMGFILANPGQEDYWVVQGHLVPLPNQSDLVWAIDVMGAFNPPTQPDLAGYQNLVKSFG